MRWMTFSIRAKSLESVELRAKSIELRAKSIELRAKSKNFLLYALSSMLFAVSCVFFFAGCGEESPLEPQDSIPVEIPGSLTASRFPTANSCSWKYVSADGGHTYTVKIVGTKNIDGFAVKRMENDSDIPVDPIDFMFPVRTSLFTKDLNSYTEYAFELWVSFWNNTYFQRNSPKRVLWSFPLYVGKEWIVSKSRTIPEVTYTRKVVSGNGVLTVPAGTYEGVYYVEEYVSVTDMQTDEMSPNKYWLAPDVGVIKYEYVDLVSNTTKTYELSEFKKSQ